MHIALAVSGWIEVDQVGDAAHVDPAGSHVFGNQRVDRPQLEPRERLLALALRLVAVHRDRLRPARAELLTSRSAPDAEISE
jgi:hypothetical protein